MCKKSLSYLQMHHGMADIMQPTYTSPSPVPWRLSFGIPSSPCIIAIPSQELLVEVCSGHDTIMRLWIVGHMALTCTNAFWNFKAQHKSYLLCSRLSLARWLHTAAVINKVSHDSCYFRSVKVLDNHEDFSSDKFHLLALTLAFVQCNSFSGWNFFWATWSHKADAKKLFVELSTALSINVGSTQDWGSASWRSPKLARHSLSFSWVPSCCVATKTKICVLHELWGEASACLCC